jgi:hypothetical protein
MGKAIAAFAFVALSISCETGDTVIVKQYDASTDAQDGAGGAGGGPLPEPDAGGCPSENGGQTCTPAPVLDAGTGCPPENACHYWRCEVLPNGQPVCVVYKKF